MNYQLLQAIKARINDYVTEINMVAEDIGQLDNGDERIAAAFPAVFVDIEYSECKNTSRTNLMQQKMDIDVTLRIAMKAYDNGKIDSNDKKRLDIVGLVHQAIQGWKPEGHISPYKRKSARPEKRTDIKVYELTYTALGTTN